MDVIPGRLKIVSIKQKQVNVNEHRNFFTLRQKRYRVILKQDPFKRYTLFSGFV